MEKLEALEFDFCDFQNPCCRLRCGWADHGLVRRYAIHWTHKSLYTLGPGYARKKFLACFVWVSQ